MKISSDRFRSILREESRRFIREAQEPAAATSLSPLGKAEIDKIASLAIGLAKNKVNPLKQAKSGAAQAAIGVAADLLPTVGTGAAVDTGLGAALGALSSAGTAGAAATATALAPITLMSLGAMGLVAIADAAWDAYEAEAEAMDRDTATACTSGRRNAYTAAIIRGKQQGMWTSDQLKLPGQAMNKKLTKSGKLTTEEGSALAIVLSTITSSDIETGYAQALKANATADKEAVQRDKAQFQKYIEYAQKEVRSKSSAVPKPPPVGVKPKPAIS